MSYSQSGRENGNENKILSKEPQNFKFTSLPLQSCGETDTSHMLVGVQDCPFPTEKGVQMSCQTTYTFTLGPSHPTLRNLLEIRTLFE